MRAYKLEDYPENVAGPNTQKILIDRWWEAKGESRAFRGVLLACLSRSPFVLSKQEKITQGKERQKKVRPRLAQ